RDRRGVRSTQGRCRRHLGKRILTRRERRDVHHSDRLRGRSAAWIAQRRSLTIDAAEQKLGLVARQDLLLVRLLVTGLELLALLGAFRGELAKLRCDLAPGPA